MNAEPNCSVETTTISVENTITAMNAIGETMLVTRGKLVDCGFIWYDLAPISILNTQETLGLWFEKALKMLDVYYYVDNITDIHLMVKDKVEPDLQISTSMLWPSTEQHFKDNDSIHTKDK